MSKSSRYEKVANHKGIRKDLVGGQFLVTSTATI